MERRRKMGLIKAIRTAVDTSLADQWKEFFYCDAIDKEILVVKGQKKVGSRSSNTKGSDNIITNGSGIVVADGQCMIIVDQGKIVEVCAEPGEFTYDKSSEPSIFSGNLGESIINTFQAIGRRFTYGGDTGKDQRVYYFNTKEIMDNMFGTPNPIAFRVVDSKIGLDVDVSVRCNGLYSYKIVNPLLFYTNVCGNVQQEYSRQEIASQLKSELLNHLAPAFARISEMEVRPNQLMGKNQEICAALKEELSADWTQRRGIEIQSVSLNSVTIPKEDEDMIKQLQKTAVMQNPNMAAATLVEAQAEAMRTAAGNKNGAMMGFMGMGMAQQAGGANAQNLFQMGQTQMTNQQAFQQPQPVSQPQPAQQSTPITSAPGQSASRTKEEWVCACGNVNTGKFCTNCAAPRPEQKTFWVCSCGASNKGKFCSECGQPKPAGEPLYRCDKCGWEPEDPKKPPKFCPECGDPFNESDIVK